MITFNDVRIIKKPEPYFIPFFRERPPDTLDMWHVIFHREFRKWIVTNDPESAGWNERPDKIQAVGYADTIEGALFLIYEHQKELGYETTVADEIRAQKQARPSNEAWAWAKTEASTKEKFEQPMCRLLNEWKF